MLTAVFHTFMTFIVLEQVVSIFVFPFTASSSALEHLDFAVTDRVDLQGAWKTKCFIALIASKLLHFVYVCMIMPCTGGVESFSTDITMKCCPMEFFMVVIPVSYSIESAGTGCDDTFIMIFMFVLFKTLCM